MQQPANNVGNVSVGQEDDFAKFVLEFFAYTQRPFAMLDTSLHLFMMEQDGAQVFGQNGSFTDCFGNKYRFHDDGRSYTDVTTGVSHEFNDESLVTNGRVVNSLAEIVTKSPDRNENGEIVQLHPVIHPIQRFVVVTIQDAFLVTDYDIVGSTFGNDMAIGDVVGGNQNAIQIGAPNPGGAVGNENDIQIDAVDNQNDIQIDAPNPDMQVLIRGSRFTFFSL